MTEFMFRPSRHHILVPLMLTVMLVCTPCAEEAAASDPSSITHLASATSITSEQRGQILAWAERWTQELSSGEPERVASGRRRLTEPLRASTVRPIFREAYTDAMVAELRPVLEGDADLFVAVNVMQIVAMLGTDGAARFLLERVSSDVEPRKQVRLWAAHGLRSIFREGVLDEGRRAPILRDLARSASRETDWLVLHRCFEALGSVRTASARERQLALLNDVLERMSESPDEPDELMRAIQYVTVQFRDQYIELSGEAQRAFGRDLAPLLGRVFNIVQLHWEAAADHEHLASSYAGAASMSERMLRIIDAQLRGGAQLPPSNIADAWRDGDRQRFQQIAGQWQSILSEPPYGRRQ